LFRVVIFYGKSNDQSVILDYFSEREINFGILAVLNNAMKGINNTGYYHQYYKIITNLVFLYFHFSYLYLFLAGNIIVYTPSQGTNREKYSIHYHIKVRNADSGGK